jgi:hypothetical protein
MTLGARVTLARPAIAKPRRAARGPSKLAVFFLAGGMDDLYSIDPKEASEVKRGILPVFTASALASHGAVRLAPAWSCLEPYLPRMQVITGIQCSTVAHPTGVRQIRQMRRNVVSEREASFITLAGEAISPRAPLHAIHINCGFYPVGPSADGRVFVDDSGGCKVLSQLHTIANDAALRETSRRALVDAAHHNGASPAFAMVDHILQKMGGTPAPAPLPDASRVRREEWPWHAKDVLTKADAMEYAWVLYALRNDLAPAVFMSPKAYWDTHWDNEVIQKPGNHQFAMGLRYILDGLAAVPLANGRSLADDVGIVIVSELGRFPYVNAYGGKDHYPQISATLIGPGLRAGKFGETNTEMLATPVSLRTGRAGRDGALMTLDDLGRTLLEWVGHPDPEGFGYDGRVLEFAFS